MDSIINNAIDNKKLLDFWYQGHHRIVEPHVFGKFEGEDALLTYQIGGTSKSGGLPNWRRMNLSEISDLKMLDTVFLGKRDTPTNRQSSWDVTYKIVD